VQGSGVVGPTILLGSRVVFREGLGRILGTVGFDIVASASSLAGVLAAQLTRDSPVLVVLDVGNDQAATIREIELIRGRFPASRIALLGDQHQLDEAHVVGAFRAGIHAYFESPNCETFIKSLELVMSGETIIPARLVSFLLRRHDHNEEFPHADERPAQGDGSKCRQRLSEREICILRCLIAGQSNKMIARNKAIAEATVKVHVKAILRKIHVRNRTQAAIWGMHNDSIIAAGRDRSPNGSAPLGPETTVAEDRAMFGVPARLSENAPLLRP
jgi:two-component system, NarL family, nitrate/nitrite response regulator NarL